MGYVISGRLALGKVFQADGTGIDAFVEPQYSPAHEADGKPEWGIFTGLSFQF